MAGPHYLSPEQRQHAFQAWRANVPWTNEEIAAAFEELASALPAGSYVAIRYRSLAKSVLRGFLSGRTLGVVLPVLVKFCEVCGKKAVYRRGNGGRCRAHKYVTDPHQDARARRLEESRTLTETDDKAFDALDKKRRRLAACSQPPSVKG